MNSEFGIAVHALVYLNHKSCTVSSAALAQNICTNPARVRKIMAKLKNAGLVSTKEGLEGGYLFEKNAGEVSLYQVSQALSLSFVASSWKSGDMDMDCLVASGMGTIMDEIYSRMNTLCGEYLKGITIMDIDREIFNTQTDTFRKEDTYEK